MHLSCGRLLSNADKFTGNPPGNLLSATILISKGVGEDGESESTFSTTCLVLGLTNLGISLPKPTLSILNIPVLTADQKQGPAEILHILTFGLFFAAGEECIGAVP